MNKIAKISVLAIGAAMVSQAVQAAYTDDDLVIGFASSSSDYVIDLGTGVPGAANTQIGGNVSLSTFNTTFGANAVTVGVIGGDNDGNIDPEGGNTIFTTTLRTGTAATSYGTAGTEHAPANASATAVDQAAAIPYGLAYGVTGTGSVGPDSSWSQGVSPGSIPVTWTDKIGNPSSALTGVETLDLWTTTDDNSPNAFTYVGDIQIDMTGSSASVIFDPVAVPEPATYGLLAGGGLLALALRRQAGRQNA